MHLAYSIATEKALKCAKNAWAWIRGSCSRFYAIPAISPTRLVFLAQMTVAALLLKTLQIRCRAKIRLFLVDKPIRVQVDFL